MTMTQAPYVKALFLSLVKLAGGVEAAAEALGVSHQRISQLTSLQSADMPTLMQVVALEAFANQPIVTAALAKLVRGEGNGADPAKESAEVVTASARLMELTVNGASRRDILAAVAAVRSELDDVPAALAEDA
jgi:hypothetical protein